MIVMPFFSVNVIYVSFLYKKKSAQQTGKSVINVL